MLDGGAEIIRRALRPAERVSDVVALLPLPRLLAPPGAVFVAATFGERQERGVGHREGLYREALERYMVTWALVVVGEAAIGLGTQCGVAARHLDPLRLPTKPR